MSPFLHDKPRHAPRRAGFTLVEMLVATALVVLIMLMFAQIFGMATTAMSRQRGMAELDQAARTITTVLTNDIHNRTFRDVQPFWPDQSTTAPAAGYDVARREGYFYISENDPRIDTDDVFQLTINVNSNFVRGTPFARGDSNARRDPSRRDPILNGKAVQLAEPIPDPDPAVATANQPDSDDGAFKWRSPPGLTGTILGFDLDGKGSSQYAEVSYFLRNGNLYRRVLLIRQPYDAAWAEQPSGINGLYGPPYTGLSDRDTVNGDGEFWRDFDYSAWLNETAAPPTPQFATSPTYITNSSASAGVTLGPPGSTVVVPISLGIPHFRFGHTVFRNDGTVLASGLPREFLNYNSTAAPTDWPFVVSPAPLNASNFIGRFTVHECSHDNFDYPGRIRDDGTGNRFNPMDPATTLNFDQRYHVTEYATGNTHRRGDDLLMSNVHSFDVQVWDDALAFPQYVNLGYDENADDPLNPGTPIGQGHYARQANTNTTYGNRFDTWHPFATLSPTPYYPTTATPPTGALLVGGPEERPLRGIRITIRYQDVSTGSMRTLVRDFSLIDPGQ